MNVSEANVSKEYVKSLIKSKIINNSRVLDVTGSIKCSVGSTTLTPYSKPRDILHPNDANFCFLSKETKDSIIMNEAPRGKKKEKSDNVKERLTQSYKSLSVETNNKVRQWKEGFHAESSIKLHEKDKIEAFFKPLNLKRENSEGLVSPVNSIDRILPKTQKNLPSSNKMIAERYPRYTASDCLAENRKNPPSNNKNLKKIGSKEYADKIINNLHNRMDSFTKTYDTISQKLNKMITEVQETNKEKEISNSVNSLTSVTSLGTQKPKKSNTRYVQESTELE